MEHVLKTRCAKTFIAKTVKPGQLTAENERLRASPRCVQLLFPLPSPPPIAIGMSTIITDFEMG
jgi:hypothetical protein